VVTNLTMVTNGSETYAWKWMSDSSTPFPIEICCIPLVTIEVGDQRAQATDATEKTLVTNLWKGLVTAVHVGDPFWERGRRDERATPRDQHAWRCRELNHKL
jgi:hypothetical protein